MTYLTWSKKISIESSSSVPLDVTLVDNYVRNSINGSWIVVTKMNLWETIWTRRQMISCSAGFRNYMKCWDWYDLGAEWLSWSETKDISILKVSSILSAISDMKKRNSIRSTFDELIQRSLDYISTNFGILNVESIICMIKVVFLNEVSRYPYWKRTLYNDINDSLTITDHLCPMILMRKTFPRQ